MMLQRASYYVSLILSFMGLMNQNNFIVLWTTIYVSLAMISVHRGNMNFPILVCSPIPMNRGQSFTGYAKSVGHVRHVWWILKMSGEGLQEKPKKFLSALLWKTTSLLRKKGWLQMYMEHWGDFKLKCYWPWLAWHATILVSWIPHIYTSDPNANL